MTTVITIMIVDTLTKGGYASLIIPRSAIANTENGRALMMTLIRCVVVPGVAFPNTKLGVVA